MVKTDWEQHLKAQQESGLSVRRYCYLHGLKGYNFHYNRKETVKIPPSTNSFSEFHIK